MMAEKDSITLIQSRENLVQRFLNKKERNFPETFSGLLDEYFRSVYAKSDTARKLTASGNPIALIALGGYGRQEQCVHSDVDILLLFEKRIPDEASELVKEILYPLWDVRLETGYAVRTIRDCLDLSWRQFDILTTLLDARFICGASPIYSTLREKFRKGVSKRHRQKSLERLVEQGHKLHADFGDSTYLLEPNLKSGHGGLRDYHLILWFGRIIGDIQVRQDLEKYGFLSHDEYHSLEKSLDFIWNIRNMLHYITGRKCDQLHFEHQIEMAKLMGFEEEKGLKAVEAFMGELHSRMDFIKQISLLTTENILLTRSSKRLQKKTKNTGTDGIAVKGRRLVFSAVEKLPRRPELLLKIFVESGRLKIPLSIEARRIVSEFKHLVNAAYRKDEANVADFEKILSSSFWEFNVLYVMHSTGLLVKFIPEFASITNKFQYNQYHLFPVDKHSIRCVQVINDFANRPFYSEVYKEVRNRKVLLFSALFHDIGKGDPTGDHSKRGAETIGKILERAGYKPVEIDDAVFLVRHHLLLVKTATRRDISDEETAIFCANTIGKIGLLRMLYLLTVADSTATGPKAWNEWTESLLRDLFMKVMNILKSGELASKKAAKAIQDKKDEVFRLKKDEWDSESLKKDLDSMSHRYLYYVPPNDIIEHLSLYRKIGTKNFLWKVTQEKKSDIRTVTVCGKDRPGFFSKLAGVFFMNGLNIVASQAYSWGGDTAMDVFKVMPPKDRIFEASKWDKAEQELDIAITDDTFLDKLMARIPKKLKPPSGHIPRPNQVRIDNSTSSFFTIIEVFTYDFPGLLFSITNALYRQGLDVRVAMVATKLDQVVDVFYVKSVEGEKIDLPEKKEKIKQALLSSLPEIEMNQRYL